MVMTEEFNVLSLLPYFMKEIETNEQLVAVIIGLIRYKKINPEEGTVQYNHMMYLYHLFVEHTKKTNGGTLSIPLDLLEENELTPEDISGELKLPESMVYECD